MNDYFIIDSHQDIAWNAVMGRDFLAPVAEWREKVSDGARLGERLVTLPELQASKVRLVIGTIFTLPQRAASRWEVISYKDQEEAHRQGVEQLRFYQTLAAENPQVHLIRNRRELEAHVTAVQAGADKIGLIISIEGADPIREPDELSWWVKEGVRLIGPAWRETAYCGGTSEPGPLKPEGYRLLAEMQKQGVVLDVSHMAEETFYNALDAYQGPIIASHSNCRKFVNTDRQLSDDMLRRLIERDGVIGTVLYDRFLVPGGEDRKSTLEDVVLHMNHIAEVAGHTRALALGTDWDGGFGGESIPTPLGGLHDLPLLAEALLKSGFSEEDVEGIFYRNWLRLLSKALAVFD